MLMVWGWGFRRRRGFRRRGKVSDSWALTGWVRVKQALFILKEVRNIA
jgi:hypothetical protein